jgi:hypothetical protein
MGLYVEYLQGSDLLFGIFCSLLIRRVKKGRGQGAGSRGRVTNTVLLRRSKLRISSEQCNFVRSSSKTVGEVGEMEKEPIKSHEDLEVYKMAFDVAMKIFELSRKFPVEERYSLTDQIRRSSRSVCALFSRSLEKTSLCSRSVPVG